MLKEVLKKLSLAPSNCKKVNLSEVPPKYVDLVKKIMKSSPIWGSHQTITFPDGFVLKGGRDTSRLDLLDFPKDLHTCKVLDIGCSIGMISIECKKRHADRVLGLDYKQSLIECAIEIKDHLNLDIEYRQFDLSKDEISEQFDYVFMLNVFHHLNEKIKIKALRMIDKITTKRFYFEAPIHDDVIANQERCLTDEDYLSHLKGFTNFSNFNVLGKSDFNRPVILCER